MARKEWFTAQELAGLPGMPTTDRGVRARLEKNLPASRPKGSGEGKGLEYARDSLPEETRQYLIDQETKAILQSDSEIQAQDQAYEEHRAARQVAIREGRSLGDPRPPVETTVAQRQCDLDRRLVLRALRQLQEVHGCSVKAAATLLLDEARAGRLTPVMVAKLKGATDGRGAGGKAGPGDGLPSVMSLRRWEAADRAGHSLAPRASRVVDLRVRGWYAPFFALTDRPQKPTLRSAHDQLLKIWQPAWADEPGGAPPTYEQAVYAYSKRSRIDSLKGRHTGSALRAHQFYRKRTYHGMTPGTEVHADGWNTHFTAPHPKTGQFVTYEVWHFHDVATRYVPPMAVGLTENTDVILQGLQLAIRELGVMCIWQTDHTSSVKNQQVLDEHSGLADRLGFTVVHPVAVGNSNANGIAENFNTWLDREARELATYQHPQRMDSGTFVRVRRITNAMVRAAHQPAERAALRAQAMRIGKGIVFDSHQEALDWLESKRQKWNAHAHRELPRVTDEVTGRLRHMSPAESLAAARVAGWEPVMVQEAVLVDQFRPHLRKKVTRGTVSPYGGMRYHHPELAHHEGEEVLVAVDKADPEHVWVKDLQGRQIVLAAFVAAVGPRSESMQEHTERKRAEAQIRLRERQIDAIKDRLQPGALEMGATGAALEFPDPATFITAERVPVGERRDPQAELEAVLLAAPRSTADRPRDYLDEMAPLMDQLAAQEAERRRQADAARAADEKAQADLAQLLADQRARERADQDRGDLPGLPNGTEG
jgi:putative transposase